MDEKEVKVNIFDMAGHQLFYEVQYVCLLYYLCIKLSSVWPFVNCNCPIYALTKLTTFCGGKQDHSQHAMAFASTIAERGEL